MTMPKDLEFWDVLPKSTLMACVAAAGQELASATPQEKQLYDAARNRLLTWKEPLKRRGKEKMIDDTETTVTQNEPEHPAPEAKPVRKAPAKKAAPAAADAAEKESTVAKSAKKTAKKTGSKKLVKAKRADGGNGVSRIPEDAKITWAGKENPFKEGSGAYERTELVRKASGKTRGTIDKIKGVRTSTVRTLLNLELVRVS